MILLRFSLGITALAVSVYGEFAPELPRYTHVMMNSACKCSNTTRGPAARAVSQAGQGFGFITPQGSETPPPQLEANKRHVMARNCASQVAAYQAQRKVKRSLRRRAVVENEEINDV